MMTDERLAPGQQIEIYTLDHKIDSGGMGVVWKASKPDRSSVAIKFPNLQHAGDSRFRELVRREAAAQLNLRHPHIVAAEDILEYESLPAIVFTYINGPNLEHEIYGGAKGLDRGKPLSLRRALQIATQILDALDYAHQHCYVHRDVKSSNILLDRNTDNAFLTDFGIVLNVARQRVTRAGIVSGSVPYMSPEQITNPMSVNLRSDVYSFGVVLYEMITGCLPFRVEAGETTDPDFLIKEKHLKSDPMPPSSINPAVPAELDRIVLQALEKTPDKRFLGCAQFLASIRTLEIPDRPARRIIRDENLVPAAVVTDPTPARPARRRGLSIPASLSNWLPWLLFGAAGLLLILLSIVYLVRRS